jgi:hypothetical protein
MSTRGGVDLRDLADAKTEVAKLARGEVDHEIAAARSELHEKNVVFIPNPGAVSASADFAILLSSAKAPEFHQLSGDPAAAKVTNFLIATKLPLSLPNSSPVEIPLRATLTCRSQEQNCRFAILSPFEAVNIARNELAAASAASTVTATHDPHVYDDPALGMRISLPDEWKLVRLEPGSFSQPRNAMFNKAGSSAMFMLTHEHFEGSLDLYGKMLDRFFASKTDFNRAGQEAIKRDGLSGMRWNVSWNQNGIVYSAVIEMFGVGTTTTASPRLLQKKPTAATRKPLKTYSVLCSSRCYA